MEQNELKNKILRIIDEYKTGVLATVEKERPHSRYMTFYHDDITLYTPTSKDTHKAEEIEKNPYVHILLGYEGEGLDDLYVEVSGKAVIREDKAIKQQFWHESMDRWFDGIDDPEFIMLEIQPESMRLMNKTGEPPQKLDL
ncbi:pyridoxamine 5'-phosphate oxidase family protein [Salibacterium halotolerans]|uniref:General stress protein 26 n=1 Tax=Salibacterium halotolerans TaxID=1884432 RepID=A0A1I5XP63_9BACI|nr:pyridoxamine 5'-phosphate oxidase family protein [Salibacterium halotolerans]SFQ33773.1 General stress protein 26 [Salibacterium halotolerans]